MRILIISVCLVLVFGKDYYKILEVPRTATKQEIKNAYRRLSRSKHPDVVPEERKEEAHKLMGELNEAYETLYDENRRRDYDMGGRRVRTNRRGRNRGFHSSGFPGDFFFEFNSRGNGKFRSDEPLSHIPTIHPKDYRKLFNDDFYPHDHEIFVVFGNSMSRHPFFGYEHSPEVDLYTAINKEIESNIFVNTRKGNRLKGIIVVVDKKSKHFKQMSNNKDRVIRSISSFVDETITSKYLTYLKTETEVENYVYTNYKNVIKKFGGHGKSDGESSNHFMGVDTVSDGELLPLLILFTKNEKGSLIERELSYKFHNFMGFLHVQVDDTNIMTFPSINSTRELPTLKVFDPATNKNSEDLVLRTFPKVNRRKLVEIAQEVFAKRRFLKYDEVNIRKFHQFCEEKWCLVYFRNSKLTDQQFSDHVAVLDRMLKLNNKYRVVIMNERFFSKLKSSRGNFYVMRFNEMNFDSYMVYNERTLNLASLKEFCRYRSFKKRSFEHWPFFRDNRWWTTRKVIILVLFIGFLVKLGLHRFIISHPFVASILLVMAMVCYSLVVIVWSLMAQIWEIVQEEFGITFELKF